MSCECEKFPADLEELVNRVLATGVHGLTQAEKQRARALLRKEKRNLARLVLTRASSSGSQPTYEQYAGVDLLKSALLPGGKAANLVFEGSQIVKRHPLAGRAFALIQEILQTLPTSERLHDHPVRAELERRIGTILHHVGKAAFPAGVYAPCASCLRKILLPETASALEPVFLACVATNEVAFTAESLLLNNAVAWIGFSRAGEALAELQEAIRIAHLTPRLFGLLAVVSREVWQAEIRSGIDDPSALQSMSYQDVQASIPNLERIVSQPRFSKNEGRVLLAIQETLNDLKDSATKWRRVHYEIANKKSTTTDGNSISPGIEWLRDGLEKS